MDESLKQKAKAQQIKNSFVSNNDNLAPDKYYKENIDCRYLRKFNCDGIIKNSVHLGRHNVGQMRITDNNRGKLCYSVGVRGKPNGTLKLYLQDITYRNKILEKDIVNLLDGWNDFRFPTIEPWFDVIWDYQGDGEVFLSVDITPKTNNKKNIIVIVLDGVRPQSIDNTKYIKNYFKHSIKYDNAFVQGEWTMPNFVSMVTGLYSTHHKVVDPDMYLKPIPDDVILVSEVLQCNGFNTMGYFGHNRVAAGFGHSRGFNQCFYRCTYDEYSQSNSKEFVNDVRVTDIQRKKNNNQDIILNSIKFLKDNKDTDNYLFLHIFDTHRPFFQTNSTISNEVMSKMNSNPVDVLGLKNMDYKHICYIREVHEQKLRDVDDNLGLLFDYIDKYESDHTKVIFTSDHGNIFYDEGIENVLPFNDRDVFLKNSLLKVPLYVKDGDVCKNIVDVVEANISIYDMVKELAGLGKHSFKGYAISESNFMDIYEVVFTTKKDNIYYRCKRDRVTGEIDYSNVDNPELIRVMKEEKLWKD
jgi:arylsulfatase A-like enzyme